jgi:hypothetical protein
MLVAGLVCLLAVSGQAGDGDTAAIIAKAIKAHFPKGMDTKNKASRTKAKGTLHIQGIDLEFNQEVTVQPPNKFKEVMEINFMGKNTTVTTVYNGADGWIRADDKDVKVTPEILTELKEAAYGIQLMQGVFLKDKTVKFASVGEVQVRGKATNGVTVSREGKKDINLFFDKRTGLLSKVEMRRRDLMSGQEVTEERFITEYQDLNGQKVAKKVEVQRDGKALLEAEVLEVQGFEKAADSDFAQPK